MAQITSLGLGALPVPVPPTKTPKDEATPDTVEFYIPLLEQPRYPDQKERPEYPLLLRKP